MRGFHVHAKYNNQSSKLVTEIFYNRSVIATVLELALKRLYQEDGAGQPPMNSR